jgi:hypothetical protein
MAVVLEIKMKADTVFSNLLSDRIMQFSRMLRRVALVRADVSEELSIYSQHAAVVSYS